jgi:iron complex outermembrane receptor protein
VTTKGFETQLNYTFSLNSFDQKLQLGYSYLDDTIKQSTFAFSQYSVNSLKHQVVGSYYMQFFKNFTNSILYRYSERTSGDSYTVVDLGGAYTFKAFEFSLFANNIFNAEYTETNFVPMPKGNLLFGVRYNFR